MTGFVKPCSRTRLICSNIFRRLAILSDSQSSKLPHNRRLQQELLAPLRLRQLVAQASISQTPPAAAGDQCGPAFSRAPESNMSAAGWPKAAQVAGCQLVNARLLDMAAMLRQKCRPTNIRPKHHA